jgi:hypothetical protein
MLFGYLFNVLRLFFADQANWLNLICERFFINAKFWKERYLMLFGYLFNVLRLFFADQGNWLNLVCERFFYKGKIRGGKVFAAIWLFV